MYLHERKYNKKRIHLYLKDHVQLIDSGSEKVELPDFYFKFVLSKKIKFEDVGNEEHHMKWGVL